MNLLVSRYSKFNSSPKLVFISGFPLLQSIKSARRSLAFYLTLLLYILSSFLNFSLSLFLSSFLSLSLSLSFFFTFISFTFLQRASLFVFPFYTFFINISQIYATIVDDFFLVFVFINLLSQKIQERIAFFVFKHLTYLYFLHCYRLLSS